MNKNKTTLPGIVLIVVIVILFARCVGGSGKSNSSTSNSVSYNSQSSIASVSKPNNVSVVRPTVATNFDSTGYMSLSAEVVYEYGDYLVGKDVLTAFEIDDISGNTIKCHTDNNDGYFYSITCKVVNSSTVSGWKKGDSVTVVGHISDNQFCVNMTDCTIIGYGEMISTLKSSESQQRTICEQLKGEYEQSIVESQASDKKAYIQECIPLNYTDVERNPDKYKGVKTKINGEVIQVYEGWFDSVTLRVKTADGTWYVSYSRNDAESRILEGDVITVYGECDGVQSYTTVLGDQLTIPAIDMTYYDLV